MALIQSIFGAIGDFLTAPLFPATSTPTQDFSRSMIIRRLPLQHFEFCEGRPALMLSFKEVGHALEFSFPSVELQFKTVNTLRDLVETQEPVDWVIDIANKRVLSFLFPRDQFRPRTAPERLQLVDEADFPSDDDELSQLGSLRRRRRLVAVLLDEGPTPGALPESIRREAISTLMTFYQPDGVYLWESLGSRLSAAHRLDFFEPKAFVDGGRFNHEYYLRLLSAEPCRYSLGELADEFLNTGRRVSAGLLAALLSTES